ncbi:MAG: hypothetical protein LUO95_04120 [Methylococcaceae bacterium]|nr:hypothetical protein [Methylococcaceae bacterium]MDD1609800.1 hypothetical protein [Methylococcaceae bacterium]MDD1616874.1 hypothetical protein [Methylococcaceae bacterium]MDD1627138.1 hypothetical protein [Methylococcaceae bacterium]OYV16620.1 MAG: hypothetical protein CG439_2041 [Methylococcaceae bacterium NSP1-2]
MFDLIKLLFDICLLKKTPQDLPFSINLLKVLAIINVIINFLLMNMSVNWFSALLKAAVGLLLMGGFSWICLFFSGKLGRFYQTTTALLGTDALLDLFALPTIATMAVNQGGLLAFLVMMTLIVWHWLITGHIMRNALEQSFSFSLGLAFLYLVVSYQVTALIIS